MSVFRWPVRVYWEDTDGGAIVYYANYLRFLERARTEWLRTLGHSQQELARDPGILFTVVSIEVQYRAPARLDDELEVSCEPRAEGAATLRFAQRICRTAPAAAAAPGAAPTLLAEASVRVACVDAQTLKPKRLPRFLLDVASGPVARHG
ncbi:MAG: tol-pal system-associated acyl-CoA thioesterase [Gammaproteobacteria bacterium]|nr:tol-pal system-associated acyl-CoA thioesterase [Gammaproteobacteria bacterium]